MNFVTLSDEQLEIVVGGGDTQTATATATSSQSATSTNSYFTADHSNVGNIYQYATNTAYATNTDNTLNGSLNS